MSKSKNRKKSTFQITFKAMNHVLCSLLICCWYLHLPRRTWRKPPVALRATAEAGNKGFDQQMSFFQPNIGDFIWNKPCSLIQFDWCFCLGCSPFCDGQNWAESSFQKAIHEGLIKPFCWWDVFSLNSRWDVWNSQIHQHQSFQLIKDLHSGWLKSISHPDGNQLPHPNQLYITVKCLCPIHLSELLQ